jgi:NitT/TauT family transport system substrate-binding protein
MQFRSLLRTLVAVVAALALGIAGCGDDGEPAGQGGGEGSGPTQLKVQETAGVPSAFMGFGIEKGFFRDRQLDIELEAAQGGAATIPALVSGDIQVGGSNVVSLLIAASRNLPIQVIAPGTSAQESGDDFGALLVAGEGDVREARDLEGKRIAVNTLNNIADVVVKAALEEEGADPSRLRLIEVPFPEMGATLANGDVDAAFSIEPFVTATVREGARVLNYSYVATEPGMQVGALAVSRRFAEQNPDVVERFRAAVAETAEYVMANEDEFRSFLSERAEIAPALAKRIVLPRFTTEVDAESLENTAGLMEKYGLLEEPVDVGALLGEGAG